MKRIDIVIGLLTIVIIIFGASIINLDWIASRFISAFFYIVILLIFLSIIAAVAALQKERILGMLLGRGVGRLQTAASRCGKVADALVKGNKDAARDEAIAAAEEIFAWYAEWQLNRFLIAASIAILASLATLAGSFLLLQQNRLLISQNSLVEAQRRSSLVFELSSIMQKIDIEYDNWLLLDEEKKIEKFPSFGKEKGLRKCRFSNYSDCSYGFPLSEPTVARIVALSRILRPYKYLDPETDQITGRLSSPERGQLLTMLMAANVHLKPILNAAELAYSDLRGSRIRNVDFTGSDLGNSDLSRAVLANVAFNEMSYAENASFENAIFCYADLGQFVTTGTSFRGATFIGSYLSNYFVRDADLSGVNFIDSWIGGSEDAKIELIDAGVDQRYISTKASENKEHKWPGSVFRVDSELGEKREEILRKACWWS